MREQVLRTEALTVALRGYQSFGARFALVQRKVVLGDEMGLGKTIEALAVLAHLWATGATHFLVVCPPGVLVNWLREVAARSTSPPTASTATDGRRRPRRGSEVAESR